MEPNSTPSQNVATSPSRGRRPWVRPCIVLGLLVAVVASVWLYNTRHHRAWLRMKAAMIARGEPMSYEDFFPPRIPDSENFAAQPLFDEFFKDPSYKSKARLGKSLEHFYWDSPSMFGDEPYRRKGDWRRAQQCDLKTVAQYYRLHPESYGLDSLRLEVMNDAEVILQSLSIHRPILDEVESYLERPGARYNLVYSEIPCWNYVDCQGDNLQLSPEFLNHLRALNNLITIQVLEAQAYLHDGKPEQSFARLIQALKLVETLANEPFFYSQDTRQVKLGHLLTIIWEGWCQSAWNLDQLEALEQSLADVDLLTGWKRTIQHLRWSMLEMDTLDYEKNGLLRVGPQFLQKLMYGPDLNRIHFCQDVEQIVFGVYDENSKLFRFDSEWSTESWVGQHSFSMDRWLSLAPIPAYEAWTRKTARNHASLALARTAIRCAIYQRREGRWPEDLGFALSDTGDQLGIDPFSGKPFHYLPPAQDDPLGLPTLYSVSINGVDDGGLVVTLQDSVWEDGIPPIQTQHGDLVWASRLKWVWKARSESAPPPDRPINTFAPFETSAP